MVINIQFFAPLFASSQSSSRSHIGTALLTLTSESRQNSFSRFELNAEIPFSRALNYTTFWESYGFRGLRSRLACACIMPWQRDLSDDICFPLTNFEISLVEVVVARHNRVFGPDDKKFAQWICDFIICVSPMGCD